MRGEPYVLGRDTESLSGDNASFFRKKEESELALRVQEEALPNQVSLNQNLGRFQQAILKEENEREDAEIKEERERGIQELFKGVKESRKEGEESYHGLPVRRYLFPNLEEEPEESDEAKEFAKRKERYRRVRDRANRSKRMIRANLRRVKSLPKEEIDSEEGEE